MRPIATPQREDPDRFDVTGDARKHLGFGHGAHICMCQHLLCMGKHLARLKMTRLIEAMARRVKRRPLAGSAVKGMNNSINAFASLPMQVALAG